MADIIYIAYGSNLHPLRLRKRCQSADLIATGRLRQRQLAFHKRGVGQSGKCNALKTSDPNAAVWVAIFRIAESDKPNLDKAEGLGHGYHEENLDVEVGERVIHGTAYIADDDAIDDHLIPFDWYKEMVRLGAEYHDFPQEYRDSMPTGSMNDPKPTRASEKWSTVEEMRAANKALQATRLPRRQPRA